MVAAVSRNQSCSQRSTRNTPRSRRRYRLTVIHGTGSLAPNQRPVLAALGFKAVLGGTLATLMTAALAGAFYGMVK
jgi:hypothetical protein